MGQHPSLFSTFASLLLFECSSISIRSLSPLPSSGRVTRFVLCGMLVECQPKPTRVGVVELRELRTYQRGNFAK
jgi:hypothetical protein